MKKNLCFFIVFGFLTIQMNAQVSSYVFSTDTTAYTEITGGISLGTVSTDNEMFVDPSVPAGGTTTEGVGLPIGFNFQFNGETFDVFGVNPNGWIGFGKSSLTPSVNLTSPSYYTPISTAATVTPAILQNRAAALGHDLTGSSSNNSSLRYETTGTAPNRILVVQWKGYMKAWLTGDNYNFQIRLYETTNVVEFIYGTMTNGSVANFSQVGLRGTSNSDYNNRCNTSSTSWSNTVAGVTNFSTMQNSSTLYPLPGLVFRFTPLSVNINNFYNDVPRINIFPNPSNGITNISVIGLKATEYVIYTIQGQTVYSEKFNDKIETKQFDFSYLPESIYFIEMSDGIKSIFQKFIIK